MLLRHFYGGLCWRFERGWCWELHSPQPISTMGLFQSKKKIDLITCGLDNSGKSTIINHLKPSKQKEEQLAPTVGYQVESFSKGVYFVLSSCGAFFAHSFFSTQHRVHLFSGKVNFKVFDMGGAKKFRNLWEHYYHDVQG